MNAVPENRISEPEYEWGVKIQIGDAVHEEWGFDEDPRTNGKISVAGDIWMNSDYRDPAKPVGYFGVIEVGKRPKVEAQWERYTPSYRSLNGGWED